MTINSNIKDRLNCIKSVLTVLLFFATSITSANDTVVALDTGGHTGIIRDLLYTNDGRYLISGSDDRTVRIWDVNRGVTVRTIRGYVEHGKGLITALALSPDEQLLAVGVLFPHDEKGSEVRSYLRIYDFESGKQVALLKGQRRAIKSLTFSPDGKHLAAGEGEIKTQGQADSPEIVIWNVSSRKVIQRLKGHSARLSNVIYTADGKKIISSSWDKTIRIWDLKNPEQVSVLSDHTERVSDIDLSPDGTEIVSVSWDKTVRLWSLTQAVPIKKLKTLKEPALRVAFTPDGQHIITGHDDANNNDTVHVINKKGKIVSSYKDIDYAVTSIVVSPNNQTVALAGGRQNIIDIWNYNSKKCTHRLQGIGRPVTGIGISNDGNFIAWNNSDNNIPAKKLTTQFQIINELSHWQALLSPEKKQKKHSFSGSEKKLKGYKLSAVQDDHQSYKNKLQIKKGGTETGSINRYSVSGHTHTAYSLMPNSAGLISGGMNGHLDQYGYDGNKIGVFSGHTGNITDLAISKDGGLVVSSSLDQTFKLWNAKTRQLLVSFFISNDNQWIAWSPDGYYSSSPDGDRYMGWQINWGPNQEADYVSAAQLKDKLYRHDIILQIIKSRSLNVNSDLVDNTVPKYNLKTITKRPKLPPKFKIISPENQNSPSVQLKLAFDKAFSLPETLEIVINGHNKLVKFSKLKKVGNTKHKLTVVNNIKLDQKENTISVVAKNTHGETRDSINIRTGSVPANISEGKRLFVVAIGINDYDDLPSDLDLDYAENDAIQFVNNLKQGTGKIFSEFNALILTQDNEPPTHANIRKALKLFSKAKPDDTVILFLAGHGLMQKSEYLFLTKDSSKLKDESWNTKTTIMWDEFQNVLSSSQGRRILFVDTCHAANAFNPELVKNGSDSNIIALTSTDGKSLAEEDQKLKHGVFSYSLIEGIKGKADTHKDGKIKITEILSFVASEVDEMTSGRQKPLFYNSGWLQDFNFVSL